MNKVNIKITLSTPLILSECKGQMSFAVFDGHIFMINFHRLSKIASLMQKTEEFNRFYSENKNITEWLQKYQLTNSEMLNELSFYKIKCDCNPDIIYTFSDAKNSDKNSYVLNYFENLIYQNIKNLILFDYLRKNTDKLNSYIEEILVFLKINPKYYSGKFNSSRDFIRKLFEGYKFKAENEISILNNIFIEFNSDYKSKNIFEINKIKSETVNFFQESIKAGTILDFSIPVSQNPKIRIEKYIQLAEYINSIRLKLELHIINSLKEKEQMQKNVQNLILTNFSFLNTEQIFYLCIEENNKKMMNELFNMNIATDLFFYFTENEDKPNFLNYAVLEMY